MSISKRTVLKFIDGNQDAIANVYLGYKNLMYFVIASYVTNRYDVDDVLSDAFMKAIERRKTIKDVDNIKAYLCTIAKNEAINFLKKNSRYVPMSDVIDEMYGERDRTNKVLNAIEPFLSNKETIVLYYRAVFDYSWKEIQDLTSIPESSARRLYSKAKEKARKAML